MTRLSWPLAVSPIPVVLVLMVGFRWGGASAGAVGWFMALLAALLFFGATPELIAYSQLKAVLLTLYVLQIIWMALVLFNVVNEAGAIEVIGAGIVHLTSNRVMQLLFLGGFSTPSCRESRSSECQWRWWRRCWSRWVFSQWWR